MKIDNKKKKIIIIAVAVILIAAIATTVGILCSQKSKNSEDTETQTVTVEVTDENGETVTDENGNAVTETEPAESTTKKSDKSDRDETTTKGKSSGKNETTTEPLSEYTTVNPDGKIELPDVSLDGLVTASYALLTLQEYYGDTYIVNYDIPNNNGTKMAFAVFKTGKVKTNIVYTVTVDEETGETIQTDKKGNKTDITNKVDYGQEK